MLKMCSFDLRVVFLCVLCGTFRPSVGCVQCLVQPKDTSVVCGKFGNAANCYTELGRLFDKKDKVIDAGKVGKAQVKSLEKVINDLFDQLKKKAKINVNDLEKASEDFITQASALPKGYQESHYNCSICKIDSCGFPLDCPVQNKTVGEHKSIKMLCDLAFAVPQDSKISKIWKFAEKVNTRQVELFKEMTVELEDSYDIPSADGQHEGTYQCEIFSNGNSIKRIYHYLTVTSDTGTGHSELHDIFLLSLLPGGKLVDTDSPPPTQQHHPSRVLIGICFTFLLLFPILSLGVMILWKRSGTQSTRRNEEL
ncbi:sperm acrosome membrane-associated protein 6 isoform X2 [Festucalex cinctus]